MKAYQDLSHTRRDANGGSRPRGENQLRLLQTTKWQSVLLDRPSDVQPCSFQRPEPDIDRDDPKLGHARVVRCRGE